VREAYRPLFGIRVRQGKRPKPLAQSEKKRVYFQRHKATGPVQNLTNAFKKKRRRILKRTPKVEFAPGRTEDSGDTLISKRGLGGGGGEVNQSLDLNRIDWSSGGRSSVKEKA